LLNVNGYYDHLLRFMDHSVTEGFLSAAQQASVLVGTDPESLLLALAAQAAGSSKPDDYSKV
jgi:predicted Rossmann-fold nucleotide-binding protein